MGILIIFLFFLTINIPGPFLALKYTPQFFFIKKQMVPLLKNIQKYQGIFNVSQPSRAHFIWYLHVYCKILVSTIFHWILGEPLKIIQYLNLILNFKNFGRFFYFNYICHYKIYNFIEFIFFNSIYRTVVFFKRKAKQKILSVPRKIKTFLVVTLPDCKYGPLGKDNCLRLFTCFSRIFFRRYFFLQ